MHNKPTNHTTTIVTTTDTTAIPTGPLNWVHLCMTRFSRTMQCHAYLPTRIKDEPPHPSANPPCHSPPPPATPYTRTLHSTHSTHSALQAFKLYPPDSKSHTTMHAIQPSSSLALKAKVFIEPNHLRESKNTRCGSCFVSVISFRGQILRAALQLFLEGPPWPS